MDVDEGRKMSSSPDGSYGDGEIIGLAAHSPARPTPKRMDAIPSGRGFSLSTAPRPPSPRLGHLPSIAEGEQMIKPLTNRRAEEVPNATSSEEAISDDKDQTTATGPAMSLDASNQSSQGQQTSQQASFTPETNEFQRAVKGLDAMQIEEELYSSLDGTTVVYKGREKYSLLYVQVKKVLKGYEDDRVLNDLVHEVRALNKLSHGHVLRHFAWYQTPRHVWVVSEFCGGGSLREVLIHHPLETDCVKDIVRDVSSAIGYLHIEKQIVHGDVRPENVYLTESGVAKVGGLSLSRFPSSTSSGTWHKPSTARIRDHILQNAEYIAPEFLQSCLNPAGSTDIELSMAADIWTFGITVYECIIGSPPFTGTSFYHLFHRVLEDEPHYYREGSSKEFSLSPFVKQLLMKAPEKRIRADELLLTVRNLPM